MRKSLAWNDVDVAISMLLGELLLQMLTETPKADDDASSISIFLTVFVIAKSRLAKKLCSRPSRGLCDRNSTDDALSLDLLSVAFLLMGFTGEYISWQDVPTLVSPINSL